MQTSNIIFAPYRAFKKQICPNCKQKTFVAFLNKDTGEIIKNNPRFTGLAGEFAGKCDRVSCGHLIHWMPVVKQSKTDVVKTDYKHEEVLEATSIPEWKYWKYRKNGQKSALFQYLINRFGFKVARDVWQRYRMAANYKGDTFYPFYKGDGSLSCAKVMRYNENTGKRVKGNKSEYTWTAGQMKDGKHKIEWLPFGYHLIDEALRNGVDTVVIHEGVKNAVICEMYERSIGYRQRLHLAAGSLYYYESINKIAHELSRFRFIKVIADKGCRDYWKWKITVPAKYPLFLERESKLKDGSDYVDWLELNNRL